MLKILSASQIREWDQATIRMEPIASIDLMERASEAFVLWLLDQFDSSQRVGVVCGTGNNGGDGLAIARMLHERKFPVKVWIVKGTVAESEDFKINLSRMPKEVPCFEIIHESDKGLFTEVEILIDAIFGTGLSRPISGIYAQVIDCFNQAKAIKVAVDIPSGLPADKSGDGPVTCVNHTVSFQLPKLGFLFPENEKYVGEWLLVDIGLNRNALHDISVNKFFLTKNSISHKIKKPNRFAHKGNFGKVLLIAGSYGKMGAAILSSRAVMRSGAGLLTVHVPRCGYSIIQMAVPEAMASVDPNEFNFSTAPNLSEFDVIGIGPGIGTKNESVAAIEKILQSGKPLIIDADALNILSLHRELMHLIPPESILTPHPGEFARLAGESKNDFERMDKLMMLSKELKSVIILKGMYTAIATPDENVFFNSTGNPGMATGGSGDVLTGILTGLRAQGYPAKEATMIGVYLHGLAGDIAAKNLGNHSMIATDIIDCMAEGFQRLRS